MIGELISSFFLLSGSLLILLGSWGVVKMPDVLCRAHALSKALTLGISLMLIGMWIPLEDEKLDLKISLAILFLLTTIPLAAHLFALLAYRLPITAKDPEEREQ